MANKYWVGNSTAGNTTPASANWNGTNAWRTTSGGTVTATTPGTGDVAIFDNNSFLGAAITVTISAATTVGSIDASGITSGANGITLAGLSNSLALSGGSATGSLLNLPSSRFTWSHSSTLTISGSGTVTTNGVTIASNVSMTATGAQPTLAGNFNGTGTFTCNGGTVTLGTYQWVCTTFTSTGSTATAISASAGGGITVTANLGTVINVTKTAAQLTFPSAKPIFTLTASGTAANRGITWTGSTWNTTTSTMPGLKLTNGSDTVSFTQTASSVNTNLASFNTTGFTGTFQYLTNTPNYTYIFGDFISPSCTISSSGAGYGLASTSNSSFLANCPSISFFCTATAVYTQAGVINCLNLDSGSLTTLSGSFTLNSTGAISGGFGYGKGASTSNLILSGDISVGTPNNYYIYFTNANTSALTSITKTGTSDIYYFWINGGTYGSSIPFVFNGSNGSVGFQNTTINGSITFNAPLANTLYLIQTTITSNLNVTARNFYCSSTVNIPSTSVINVVSTDTNTGTFGIVNTNGTPSLTNKFRVNINTATSAAVDNTYIYCDFSSLANAPDCYISGGGYAVFDTSNGDSYYPSFTTLDTTAYTAVYTGGASLSGAAYIKNSLVQSSTYPAPFVVYAYGSATGTLDINSTAIFSISAPNINSQTLNISSSTLQVSSSFSTNYFAAVNLNSCTITFPNFGIISFPTSNFNAGTSTLRIPGSSINTYGQNLYNVVIYGNSSSSSISAGYVNSITNSIQPVTVSFGRDISFGTFGLNGTAGNLVTVTGALSTQRTLTKSTPWNLGNSTDGGNNAGLNFLGSGSGNNDYLSVSYINGVFSLPITGDTASGFAGTTTYLKDVTVGATSVSASGFAATPIYALTSAVTNASASGVAATPTYAYSTLLGNNTANGFVGTETYSSSVLVNATGVAASGFASTPAYALTTTLANTSASGFAATPAYALTAPLTNVSASGFASTPAYSYLTLLSGNAASGLLGTVIYLKDVNVGATSVTASGFVSSPTYAIDKAVTSTTGSGAVATPTYEVAPSLASVVGSGVASGIGSYTAQYLLVGVYANGRLGDVVAVYWKPIDNAQSANWTLIGSAQAPTWTVVDNAQGGGWTLINT